MTTLTATSAPVHPDLEPVRPYPGLLAEPRARALLPIGALCGLHGSGQRPRDA